MDDMATTIRSNISKDNPYFIPKERYLELKHFCLQYHDWMRKYQNLTPTYSTCPVIRERVDGHGDPTANLAIERDRYIRKIQLVQQAAFDADPELVEYILRSVTEGCSYTNLSTYYQIPCCKDTFYDRYRKFFYILSQRRD